MIDFGCIVWTLGVVSDGELVFAEDNVCVLCVVGRELVALQLIATKQSTIICITTNKVAFVTNTLLLPFNLVEAMALSRRKTL